MLRKKPQRILSCLSSNPRVWHMSSASTALKQKIFSKNGSGLRARERAPVNAVIVVCVEEYEKNLYYQIRLPKFDKISLFVCRGLSQWMDLKAFRLTRKFVTYPSAPVGSGKGQHDSFLLDLFNSVTQGGALKVRFCQRVVAVVDPRPRRWPLRPAWCPSPGEWRA